MRKELCTSFVLGNLVLLGSALNSGAWLKVGAVYCDANTNGLIDAIDIPV